MMRFLRSWSQTVLIAVLAVLGLGFLFYGNAGNLLTSAGTHVHNDFGRIDHTDITMPEFAEAVRNTRDSYLIQGPDRVQQLSQPGLRKEIIQEAWRQMLLMHEADRLHITIDDSQVKDAIENMPAFQKNGVYNPDLYKSQMVSLQNGLHISPVGFFELIKHDLRLNAVNKALFSTIRASSQDISAQYEKLYAPVQVTVVSLDSKPFVSSAQVTPEEIQNEYKNHSDNPAYRTKEKRKIDYVFFNLTPEQAKLTSKDKNAALEALGEKALNFAVSLQPDPTATNAAPPLDFITGAKKLGLTPGTTDFFTEDTTPTGVAPSPAFNSAAFSLTKENPISKVVALDNGVAVLHLVEIQPSDLRPLDEVKPDIVKSLQQNKGMVAQEAAAQAAVKQLKDAVAKGTDFKAAATAAHLKTETVSNLVPMKAAQNDPRQQTLAYIATTLDAGGISNPIPSQVDGSSLIVHLDSRGKADPAGLAQFETQYRDRQEQNLRNDAYIDWANWAGRQPGTRAPADLDQYAAVVDQF